MWVALAVILIVLTFATVLVLIGFVYLPQLKELYWFVQNRQKFKSDFGFSPAFRKAERNKQLAMVANRLIEIRKEDNQLTRDHHAQGVNEAYKLAQKVGFDFPSPRYSAKSVGEFVKENKES